MEMCRRLLATLAMLAAALQVDGTPPQQQVCLDDLLRSWNVMAADVNRYVQRRLVQGIVDVHDDKVRARLDKEWRAVTSSECW